MSEQEKGNTIEEKAKRLEHFELVKDYDNLICIGYDGDDSKVETMITGNMHTIANLLVGTLVQLIDSPDEEQQAIGLMALHGLENYLESSSKENS